MSDNALGRAFVLARVLQKRYNVTILGPRFYRDRIWPPCDTQEIPIQSVHGKRYPAWLARQNRLRDMIYGSDIVYAVKARPVSLGLGLWAREHHQCPLILDIDDWEVGGYLDYPVWRRCLLRLNLSNPNGYTFTRLVERRVQRADAITTVSTFLQQRYGGIIVPHGRDASQFDPKLYDSREAREHFGLPQDKRLLLFLGTPRPHKGLDTLLEAHARLLEKPDFRDVHTIIAGVDWTHAMATKISEWSSHLPVTLLGMQPFAEAPRLIATADVVVVPQATGHFSRAQIPAKLVDAMAMGKPIVASAVSDIADVLDGCGITVPSGDARAMSDAISDLLTHGDLAHDLGDRARQRFLTEYTWDVMADRLLPLVEGMI